MDTGVRLIRAGAASADSDRKSGLRGSWVTGRFCFRFRVYLIQVQLAAFFEAGRIARVSAVVTFTQGPVYVYRTL